MITVSFTVQERVNAKALSRQDTTLMMLSERIRLVVKPTKEAQPLLSFCHYGNTPSPDKGIYRWDGNVECITGIVGDYDGGEISPADAHTTLRQIGITHLIYPTWQATPEQPRWRVICPFSQAYPASEHFKFMSWLNGIFDGKLGDESFALSRAYYFGHPIGSEINTYESEGDPLDLCHALAHGAKGKSARRPSHSGNGYDTEWRGIDIDATAQKLFSGEALHISVGAIVGKLAHDGVPVEGAISFIGLLFDAAAQPRYAGRWNECVKFIDYIYAKEARSQTPPPVTSWPWIWHKVDWDLYPPPAQDWSIPNIIPSMEVCLLSGHGATGKSTIGLWEAAAHVMAGDWMNALPKPGGAFFIDAEDALDVIHRRLDPIRAHYGTNFETMFGNGLQILPMAGEDALMATVNRDNRVLTTPFYHHILERAGDHKPEQIVIASAANVFGGNENDRSQVQQFIGLLKRIAIITGGSITLITHPSLTGLSTKSALSGSTQWHNAVRARMVLESIEGNGEEKQTDSDLRQLSFFKNQYGKRAASITLRWSGGMFLPVPEKTDYERAAEFQKAEQVFTTLLRRFLATRRQVSPKPSARNNAPKIFAEQEEAIAAKCSKADLWAAMERLLKTDTIKVSECGPPSQRVQFLEFP
jgi:RecA-family ATPase